MVHKYLKLKLKKHVVFKEIDKNLLPVDEFLLNINSQNPNNY